MEIPEFIEVLKWTLSMSNGKEVKVRAGFADGAKCRIVRTQVGVEEIEAHEEPIYETKIVCEDNEEEFHA